MFFLPLNAFCYRSLVEIYGADIVSLSPKLPAAEFVLEIGMLVENARRALSFRHLKKVDALIFGGILTRMCTRSGMRCPFIISTSLYLYKVLSISLMLALA